MDDASKVGEEGQAVNPGTLNPPLEIAGTLHSEAETVDLEPRTPRTPNKVKGNRGEGKGTRNMKSWTRHPEP